MNLDKLKAMLIIHEGLKLKVYIDTVGKRTIGIGHNIDDNPLPFEVGPEGITYKQAMDILNDDIQKTIAFLSKECPWWMKLNDVRQRAITDMTFNLMSKILQFKGMIGCIEAKDWDGASSHLLNSLFAKQVGKRAVDLANMIKTGQDNG